MGCSEIEDLLRYLVKILLLTHCHNNGQKAARVPALLGNKLGFQGAPER